MANTIFENVSSILKVGLEPTRAFKARKILSLLWLPISSLEGELK
jgi:hypothetical protein